MPRFRNQFGLTGFGFSVTMLASVAVLFVVVFALVISLSRHFGRQACHTYASTTGRETRFVIYSTLGTGDCITPSGDGHWISTSQLRGIR